MLQNGIDGTAYRFMNRMSDLLFVMARSVAQREGIEERPYKKE